MTQEITKFRLRGFNCPQCKVHNEQFGLGDPQGVCYSCGHALNVKPDSDLWIQEVKTVEVYSGQDVGTSVPSPVTQS